MERIKIMVVEDNEETIEGLKRHFEGINNLEIVGCATDGLEGIKLLKKIKDEVDLILLDLIMPNRDGFWFLQQLKDMQLKKKVIIQSSYNTNMAVQEASKYGINFFISKPYDLDYMVESINKVMEENLIFNYNDLPNKTMQLLHELGVPSHIKGYQYLKESVMLVCNDINYLSGITKLIYPEIAEKYNSTVTRVERSIRHAIEVGINRSSPDIIQSFFGRTIRLDRDKPTNSEYIAAVAESLRNNYK